MRKPFEIIFSKIGEPSIGYISVAEGERLPFEPKRVYWTYFTPEDVMRGGHAHYELEQILVAAAGKITVYCEMPDGYSETFVIDTPNKGVFLPKYCWHTMKYSHNAVQMCIANMEYDSEDYIREYDKFKSLSNDSSFS